MIEFIKDIIKQYDNKECTKEDAIVGIIDAVMDWLDNADDATLGGTKEE